MRAGKVRRRITGGYVWKRPNEKVKLYNFNRRQVNMIRPTLESLDKNLQYHVQLDTKIKVAKPGQVERRYVKHIDKRASNRIKVGALTYPHHMRKSTVLINPKTFSGGSYYHPGGVLAHEVGHLAQHQANLRAKRNWDNIPTATHRKTRQTLDRHEDFAESFRSQLNQPLTRKKNRYFKVNVDSNRAAHLNRYYLKNDRSLAAKKGWRKRRSRGR